MSWQEVLDAGKWGRKSLKIKTEKGNKYPGGVILINRHEDDD